MIDLIDRDILEIPLTTNGSNCRTVRGFRDWRTGTVWVQSEFDQFISSSIVSMFLVDDDVFSGSVKRERGGAEGESWIPYPFGTIIWFFARLCSFETAKNQAPEFACP